MLFKSTDRLKIKIMPRLIYRAIVQSRFTHIHTAVGRYGGVANREREVSYRSVGGTQYLLYLRTPVGRYEDTERLGARENTLFSHLLASLLLSRSTSLFPPLPRLFHFIFHFTNVASLVGTQRSRRTMDHNIF